ncbi:MAG TPA: type VI secretion system tip protein VgrG [Longimicrobium sp.]
MPREHHLLGAYVTLAVNRVAAARLVYADGSASGGDFPLSNADTFLPGQEVEIQAGAGSDPVTLFKGIVVRQSLKVRDHAPPQLVVECRHAAVKLTVGRKSAYWLDQADGEVMTALLDGAGIAADVESTAVTHPQLVQFACTDWDFLVARAEANGRLVLAKEDGGVSVKAPVLGGSATVSFEFGATLLELDAEMDARGQYAAVRSRTWDAGQQAVVEKEAVDPGVAGAGNVEPHTLAEVVGLEHLDLPHAALPEEEAQAWADAQWLKSRMSKTSGRLKSEGIATVRPGDLVSLGGVGERFGGTVFVTGVRHDFDLVQGWKTHVQFGGVDSWRLEEEGRVNAPRAGALVPGVGGLQVGVVVSNEDPQGEHRVRVRMPLVSEDADGAWARVAMPDAGAERGWFFRPEVGDEVALGFVNDDPRQPVVLGMLHSSARAPHLSASDDNHEKGYQSRSKIKLTIDDEKKVVTLETPAGNVLTLSEQDKTVSLVDQNGNTLEMTSDGITVQSARSLTLKAGTELKLESGTALSVKGGSELKMEGAAGAELSSSAITKVKGSLLQLN